MTHEQHVFMQKQLDNTLELMLTSRHADTVLIEMLLEDTLIISETLQGGDNGTL